MKLGQDWVTYQRLLHPRERRAVTAVDAKAPAGIVSDGDLALKIFSESDELTALSGSPMSEVRPSLDSSRAYARYDAEAIDRALMDALAHERVHDQIESMRAALPPAEGKAPRVRKNFLLRALTGWWSRILPSSYGVYLRLGGPEGGESASLLILVRRGRIDQFAEPDLSSLSAERRADPPSIVKYLGQKYSVRVQGVWAPREEWASWCVSDSPWRKVGAALRTGKANLVPFRWLVAVLAGARAYLGF